MQLFSICTLTCDKCITTRTDTLRTALGVHVHDILLLVVFFFSSFADNIITREEQNESVNKKREKN